MPRPVPSRGDYLTESTMRVGRTGPTRARIRPHQGESPAGLTPKARTRLRTTYRTSAPRTSFSFSAQLALAVNSGHNGPHAPDLTRACQGPPLAAGRSGGAQHQSVIILRHGKPAAALVPIDVVTGARPAAPPALSDDELERLWSGFGAGDGSGSAVADLIEGRRRVGAR